MRIADGTLTIDVTLVADGRRSASVVAGDVQRNVYPAVRATHDLEPRRIAIHVIDIALPA